MLTMVAARRCSLPFLVYLCLPLITLTRQPPAQATESVLHKFFSDNGGLVHRSHRGEHTPATSNQPLRSGKGFLYEGGIRVPLIIRWPGVAKPGTVCHAPAHGCDLLPTICQAAGIDPDAPNLSNSLDGQNLEPLLRDPARKMPLRTLFWHYPHFSTMGGRPSGAVRHGNWKLLEHFETGAVELYDLENDIGETKDLSKTRPDKAEQLHRSLVDWRTQMKALLPSQPNPNYRGPKNTLGMGFITFFSRFAAALLAGGVTVNAADLSVTSHDSIQAALDANPGRMIFVPAGQYTINEKIRIRGERAGLFGPGCIVQQNPDQPVIEIEDANGAEIRDLTLTRPAGRMETDCEGILAIRCRDAVIDNVRVIDNRTRSGAITLRECQDSRISRCLVRNYMRVSIDDRTGSKDWGYAFHCTDGTGISVSHSTGILIEGNRVIEEKLVPTPEIKAKHKLGDFAKRNPQKGTIINQQTWDAGYTDNWQQGSGIIVTAPEASDLIRILGNHVENAAQGIDLHCDHVIVSQNIVSNAFIGMKAMHGSRNVLISGNQFTRNSLWAIGLMPGAAANAENYDGGSIIANNIISDFGHGDAHWIWGKDRSPFKFDTGQQPDDPPLADVIVQGNIVQSVGEPRYQYAVIIAGGPNTPRGLHFSNNLLQPGSRGVANKDLPP